MTPSPRMWPVLVLVVLARPVAAQPSGEASVESGIPIRSDAVIDACGQCHGTDEPEILSRISFRRTTPEGWQRTIKRMVSLNDLSIEPGTARDVVAYLSNKLGLAPEEALPGAFEVEHRMIDYQYSADRDTETTCSACHSMGRVITQRRTREEWELVVAMHRGYYPLVDIQGFRATGIVGRESASDDESPARRHPMNRAIDHLSKAFPLHTAAWTAWSATMRAPRIEGAWAVSGRHPGRGPVFGQMTVTADPDAPGQFLTETRVVYARDGRTATRTGKAIVYTGFQWRGSASQAGGSDETAWREVMFVSRDWSSISGRWFRGAYDEIGLDVSLKRVTTEPLISGVEPRAVHTATRGLELRIYGSNLPAALSPADLSFGTGIEVTGIVGVTPEVATVRVNVSADADVGARDLFIGRAARDAALVVFDHVDRLAVVPKTGMARVGGVVVPKQYQQFEAVAFHDGPDGKPDTDDDLDLGPVEATWSLEEYSATFGDDDVTFVGAIDATGLFTPAEDGPNPDRPGNRNNVGDVWVVASATPGPGQTLLRARAHLLVTVPLFMRWDAWGIGR